MRLSPLTAPSLCHWPAWLSRLFHAPFSSNTGARPMLGTSMGLCCQQGNPSLLFIATLIKCRQLMMRSGDAQTGSSYGSGSR